MSGERFSVLLTDRTARDPMALAKALAAARKTPVQDQVAIARKSWGVIAENLSSDEAQGLSKSLQASGIPSVVCLSSSMPALPPAEPVTTAPPLLAAKPVLIAAAAITITTTTTKITKEGPGAASKILSAGILLTTGLPIKIGGKERTVEKKQEHSDLQFYLDLLYANPTRRVRVDAQNFDYSFLKERKLYQVLGNFKLLLGDAAKFALDAWQNHGTQVLLKGAPIQTMGYQTLSDLDRESRWLLTLRQLSQR